MIGEVEAAKPTSCGGLLVTATYPEQGAKMLQLEHFLEEPVLKPAVRQNTTEGLAYAPSLVNVPDEELVLELRSHGVIGVRRLRPKNGNINPGIRLRPNVFLQDSANRNPNRIRGYKDQALDP